MLVAGAAARPTPTHEGSGAKGPSFSCEEYATALAGFFSHRGRIHDLFQHVERPSRGAAAKSAMLSHKFPQLVQGTVK